MKAEDARGVGMNRPLNEHELNEWLAAIGSRVLDASPGHWGQGMSGDKLLPEVDNGVGFGFVVVNPDLSDDGAGGIRDAEFIACSHADVLWLLDHCAALRSRVGGGPLPPGGRRT